MSARVEGELSERIGVEESLHDGAGTGLVPGDGPILGLPIATDDSIEIDGKPLPLTKVK